MENKPIRVQRKRTKGFKLPPNTVCVTRGTKFGNPFVISESMTRIDAIEAYERMVFSNESLYKAIRTELKGKNLACFCPIELPCHVDLLLEIANY